MREVYYIAGVAALAIGIGGLFVTRREERRAVRLAMRNAAMRYGLNPDWLDAISKYESGGDWQLNARNMSGADGARGGAWGPSQITEKTARAHGYTGAMESFTKDAELAGEWTARIMAAGSPETFADAIAWWNAGRSDADRDNDGAIDDGRAPVSTIQTYQPRALAALAFVTSNPIV